MSLQSEEISFEIWIPASDICDHNNFELVKVI